MDIKTNRWSEYTMKPLAWTPILAVLHTPILAIVLLKYSHEQQRFPNKFALPLCSSRTLLFAVAQTFLSPMAFPSRTF